jgi:isopenicillin N synthase-like dioxygenase
MATIVTETVPAFRKLELVTAYGPVYRDVSTSPPRLATEEEIPIIDLSGMYGDVSARTALAEEFKKAATTSGFFYIKNHGISEEVIDNAKRQADNFFAQSENAKMLVSRKKSKYYNGYSGRGVTQANKTETPDSRETFGFRYEPQYDPDYKDPAKIPEEIKPFIRGEGFVWEGTQQLSGFKEDVLTYWKSCLILARRMVRIFALALDLPENYFDSIVTYPGSDCHLNYYRAMTPEQIAAAPDEVGLGSHTDLQCFTLLWQDSVGGLQVLSSQGQWLKAPPKPGSIIVNIGDFLMRLSNDRFKSTVHRVYNHATVDRFSIPFFFGFNFNEQCGVLPTCTDENNPPKYEPITCGEVRFLGLLILDIDFF